MCRRFVKKILWIFFVFAIIFNSYATGVVKSINDDYYNFNVIVDLPSFTLEKLKATILEESYNISKIYVDNYSFNGYKQLSIIFNVNGKRFIGVIVEPDLLREVFKGMGRGIFYEKLIETGLIVYYNYVTMIQ